MSVYVIKSERKIMRKIIFLTVLLVMMFISISCNQQKKDVKIIEPFELNYKIIEVDSLDETVKDWYHENKVAYGYYTLDNGENEKYLLVSAGKKNAGGYSLKVNSIEQTNQQITFKIDIIEPSTDKMVIQDSTYPNMIIKVTGNKSIEVKAQLTFEESESIDSPKSKFDYNNIEGYYIGQIDNNFIEVRLDNDSIFKKGENIEENFIALMLSEEARNSIETLESEENITFSCYKDKNATWIVKNIKVN